MLRRQARLGGKPDRRVGGTVAAVVVALDDLEEEAVLDRVSVDVGISLTSPAAFPLRPVRDTSP